MFTFLSPKHDLTGKHSAWKGKINNASPVWACLFYKASMSKRIVKAGLLGLKFGSLVFKVDYFPGRFYFWGNMANKRECIR